MPAMNQMGRLASGLIPRCGIGSFGPMRFGLPSRSMVGSGAKPARGSWIVTRWTPSSGFASTQWGLASVRAARNGHGEHY